MESILKNLFSNVNVKNIEISTTKCAANQVIEWCKAKIITEMNKSPDLFKNLGEFEKIVLISKNYEKYKQVFLKSVDIIVKLADVDDWDLQHTLLITVDFTKDRTRYFIDDLGGHVGKRRIRLDKLISLIESLNSI